MVFLIIATAFSAALSAEPESTSHSDLVRSATDWSDTHSLGVPVPPQRAAGELAPMPQPLLNPPIAPFAPRQLSTAGVFGLRASRIAEFDDDACFKYASRTIWWGAAAAGLSVIAGATGGAGSLGDEPISPLGWTSIGTGAAGAFTGFVSAARTALHAGKCKATDN